MGKKTAVAYFKAVSWIFSEILRKITKEVQSGQPVRVEV
jgi:hypothetical protein